MTDIRPSLRRPLLALLALGLAGCAVVAEMQGPESTADGQGSILELQRRAFADNILMRFEDAETLYRESALRSGDTFASGGVAQIEQELYLALNKSNLGEIEPAEELFATAIAKIDARGDAVSRVKARVFLAQHRLNTGDAAGTVAEADRAIAIAEAAKAGRGLLPGAGQEYLVPTADGIVLSEEASQILGDASKSAIGGEIATGALTAEQELAVLTGQAEYVAAAAALSGGPGDPAARLASASARLEPVPPVNAVWLRAEIARLSAETRFRAGDYASALDDSGEAVRLARRYAAGERPEALLLLQEGRMALAADETGTARTAYDRAIDILARGGRGVSYDLVGPYLELLAEEAPSAERDRRLFLAIQQIRDPATSETLARLAARLTAGSSAAAQAIRAVEDAERAVNREAAKLDRLTAAAQRDVNAIRVTQERLAEARAALAEAETARESAAPNYRQIADSSVTLAQVQSDLRPGELFLQLRLGFSGSVVAAITSDSFDVVPLAVTRPEAQALVDTMRASIYEPFFAVGAARELYAAVFGPVDQRIAAAESVIVAPDGPLLSIPPGLLVAEDPVGYTANSLDYSSVPWFGTVKAVSVTLSLASFHHLRQVPDSAAPEPFRGFGDFVPYGPQRATTVAQTRSAPQACLPVLQQLGQLAPLPGTAEEVRRLAQIAGAGDRSISLGDDFTDTGLDDLGQARILHFATHGLLPLSADCLPEPALATSLGPGGDGLLSAGEIVEFDLDADLVVLSACDTGGRGATSALGAGFRATGGEALGGLVRAFFYAGARNVVASHWQVPDTETVALMEAMYRGLSAGESPATALRSARRQLAGDPLTSHPYFWAAFSVIGDAVRESRLAAAPGQVRAARLPAAR